jgi:hypothetical protein
MTDSERIARLERAIVELSSGVDWSGFRSTHGRADLNAIVREREAAGAAAALKRRAAEIEAELAGLKGAA